MIRRYPGLALLVCALLIVGLTGQVGIYKKGVSRGSSGTADVLVRWSASNEIADATTASALPMGTSTSNATIVGRATSSTTAVGNVGTGTDDLITYSLPANALSANGKGVRITAWGTAANNANAKTVTCNFGATAVITTALTASQAGTWKVIATAIRTGASAHEVGALLLQGGTTTIVDVEQSNPTDSTTAAITIKCTGAATSDNDIVQEALLVEMIN